MTIRNFINKYVQERPGNTLQLAIWRLRLGKKMNRLKIPCSHFQSKSGKLISVHRGGLIDELHLFRESSETSMGYAVVPTVLFFWYKRQVSIYGTLDYPEKWCLCFHNPTVNIFFVGQEEPIIKRYVPNMHAFTALRSVCVEKIKWCN